MSSDPGLEQRQARLEGKHESLEVYLPRLLARFEHMEREIKADLASMRQELRWAPWQRVGIILAIAAIPVTIAAAAFLS